MQPEHKVNARLSRAAARVLEPAEWVQAQALLHRNIYLPAAGVLVVWLPLLIWAHLAGLDLLAALALAVVAGGVPLLFVWAWLRARSSFVVLTDQRLIAVSGPFPRRVVSLRLADLDAVHVRQARFGHSATLYASPFLDADGQAIVMDDLAGAQAFAGKVRAASGM